MSSKRLYIVLLSLFLGSASNAYGAARGETFACYFGRYGKVVIDTREPGSSITVGDKKYAAQSGSYFYQTEEGPTVFFGPAMKVWTYADPRTDSRLRGVKGQRCVRHSNSR